MVLSYARFLPPAALYSRVIDDFGNVVLLIDIEPPEKGHDAFSAAFAFACAAGAVPVVNEGERH